MSMLSFQSSHKRIRGADVERVKEMFKQVLTARIEELENHDVHTTVEILIGETPVKSDNDDDSDNLPVIDLTVSVVCIPTEQNPNDIHGLLI